MFTGIIKELGQVKSISRRAKAALLEVCAKQVAADASIGDSVSVNGVCLSVIEKKPSSLAFEVMEHTFKTTNLGQLRPRDRVNLESALKMGDKVSGHFVSGHVDCTGIIRRKQYIRGDLSLEITVSPAYSGYILDKGSVSLDGISLTIAQKKSGAFCVFIIPHTLKNTTLGFKGHSDKVNVEFDMLAKSAISNARS
ncbi:MAG: riboflavin synthase [Candidatus Omnitrophica bacterium]|nr:riboflavin synthase [Candidatus Omnitrophota bacterium]